MSKRSLSPAPLPVAKRLHTGSGKPETARRTALSFNDFLFDELVLYIFSHLSWIDLCAAQATSRHWYRLAADSELWRNLYRHVFGRSCLRGSRGYVVRSDGREVRPLPGWANTKQEPAKDWKWMFRISSNWKKGRCALEELDGSLPCLAPRVKSSWETHILLAGPLTIAVSSQPSDIPTIRLLTPSTTAHSLPCESRSGRAPVSITTIAIDQSPPLLGQLRLAAFLSTGEFTAFSINPTQPSASTRKFTYVPNRGRPTGPPVIQAVYHHPLLITLSQNFHLSIYDLSDEGVKHTQTLSSFTSFPPTSLVLSTPSPTTYKLVLAYTIPIYPAHWSVGATELIISGPASSRSSSALVPASFFANDPPKLVEPMCVISSRTTRALDTPNGWIDEDKLRSMREQWGRKVSRVTDTQTDGKWVVLAPAEAPPSSMMATTSFASIADTIDAHEGPFLNSSTTLQLYRLYLPSPSNSIAASPPKLVFQRYLHGQTGPISSLALADGRCVSLGLNGSLWVWDLEAGTGAEVCEPNATSADNYLVKRGVAFDERRIVTTEGSRVFMRRFDI